MWPYLICLRHSEALAVLARLITGERLSSSCLLVVCHHFLAQMRCLIKRRAGWEARLCVKGGCKTYVLVGPLRLSLGSRAQSCNYAARPKAAVSQAAVNVNSSLMPKGEGLRFLLPCLFLSWFQSYAFLTLVEYDSVFPLALFGFVCFSASSGGYICMSMGGHSGA